MDVHNKLSHSCFFLTTELYFTRFVFMVYSRMYQLELTQYFFVLLHSVKGGKYSCNSDPAGGKTKKGIRNRSLVMLVKL